jgi:peptidoglycan/LPS O-acetylase OafA/YrhL
MTRRIEVGPVLVGIGAILLLVSVFLDWFTPAVTGWDAFEVLDLALVGAALTALVAAAGVLVPNNAAIERRWLSVVAVLVLVIVVSQILDPPPGVDGDPDSGAWLALAAAIVLSAGAALSLGRISFALTVQERGDSRRRVAAVDARTDPTTGEVIAPAAGPEPADGAAAVEAPHGKRTAS